MLFIRLYSINSAIYPQRNQFICISFEKGEKGLWLRFKGQNEMSDFTKKVEAYWTRSKLEEVTGNRKLLITPSNAPELLHGIGILNNNGVMSSDSAKKFMQINHMTQMMLPYMKTLAERFPTVQILDFGCGNSYLTFLLAWLFRVHLKHPAKLIGIDLNEKVITQSKQRASQLNFSELEFHAAKVEDASSFLPEGRYHAVIALHACDTATDHALAYGILNKSDFIAVAPCCQAELAQEWRKLSGPELTHALSVLMNSAELRRDSAATFTDAIRLLLLRACGYEALSTEFISSQHTPKNRLITGTRRGNFLRPAFEEYKRFLEGIGRPELILEKLLQPHLEKHF